jgi:hypothetical protein
MTAANKARAWCSEPLIEWTPELLPGYGEAMDAIAQGKRPTYPGLPEVSIGDSVPVKLRRPRRPVDMADLKARLAKVDAQLLAFDDGVPADRAAAWMNTGTKSGRAMARKHYANLDAQLIAYTRLTARRTTLLNKINRGHKTGVTS